MGQRIIPIDDLQFSERHGIQVEWRSIEQQDHLDLWYQYAVAGSIFVRDTNELSASGPGFARPTPRLPYVIFESSSQCAASIRVRATKGLTIDFDWKWLSTLADRFALNFSPYRCKIHVTLRDVSVQRSKEHILSFLYQISPYYETNGASLKRAGCPGVGDAPIRDAASADALNQDIEASTASTSQISQGTASLLKLVTPFLRLGSICSLRITCKDVKEMMDSPEGWEVALTVSPTIRRTILGMTKLPPFVQFYMISILSTVSNHPFLLEACDSAKHSRDRLSDQCSRGLEVIQRFQASPVLGNFERLWKKKAEARAQYPGRSGGLIEREDSSEHDAFKCDTTTTCDSSSACEVSNSHASSDSHKPGGNDASAASDTSTGIANLPERLSEGSRDVRRAIRKVGRVSGSITWVKAACELPECESVVVGEFCPVYSTHTWARSLLGFDGSCCVSRPSAMAVSGPMSGRLEGDTIGKRSCTLANCRCPFSQLSPAPHRRGCGNRTLGGELLPQKVFELFKDRLSVEVSFWTFTTKRHSFSLYFFNDEPTWFHQSSLGPGWMLIKRSWRLDEVGLHPELYIRPSSTIQSHPILLLKPSFTIKWTG